jgi:hypothetical protein
MHWVSVVICRTRKIRHMRNRLLTLLTAALLAVGVSLANPTPALAAYGGDCAVNSFCLYQWRDLGTQVAGNRWQSSLQNIYNHPGHCLNLPPAKWANGTNVSDNSGSLEYRLSESGWRGSVITAYNWTNCNPGGGSFYFQNDREGPGPGWGATFHNLSVETYSQNSITLYHTITSISVTYER